MLIDLQLWNTYFGTQLTELPFGEREEGISLSLFYSLFPNIPKDLTTIPINDYPYFEKALMEQLNFMIENASVIDGEVGNITNESIEGYSYSKDPNKSISSGNQTLRLSPNAENYIMQAKLGYMGVNIDKQTIINWHYICHL